MSGPKSKAAAVVVTGPLASFKTAYGAELHELGYTPLGAVKQLRQVARLSRWLELSGIGAADLSEEVLERFLAVRPCLARSSSPGLAALLAVLRRAGVAVEAGQGVSSSANDLLDSFRHHLLVERGIGISTADRYIEYARRFLADRSGTAELRVLTTADVTRCVQRDAARVAVASTQYFVAGLRAFLRFCFIEGLVESDLSAAALAVTGRRRSSLPMGISPAEAAGLLGSCDRRRDVGQRDYAILLVLLRLGLRASEVAGFTLDDIDWRAGQIVVHGKARHLDRLPLPDEVGEAIVGYLRRGRPRSPYREVFLRAVAPIGPLDRGGVSWIVRRACHRAGIAEVGAHRLRHTLACDLVTAGAGLPEIGHRRLESSLTEAAQFTELLLTPPTVLDPVSPEPLGPTSAGVRFKEVTFAHAGAPPLFTGLDLTVPSGTKIGLVGRSGGGKTTLTRLLLRLMDIDEGRILVGGQDISRLRQADLRSLIAYVPQDPAMFHWTLRDNIAFARPGASDAEIYRAAQAAHVTEFAEALPDGLDTMVGERGIKLSGGQRQRVAIARAILRDAPILLLDEVTSALDSESEVLIQQTLWQLMDGRTALVVAHRLSTVVRMDQLVVLDRGRIVEQGTHDELLQTQGTYARLWRHQSGGFLDDNDGTSPSDEANNGSAELSGMISFPGVG